jgi:hypothetical protein
MQCPVAINAPNANFLLVTLNSTWNNVTQRKAEKREMADQKVFGPHHHHDLIGDNPRPEDKKSCQHACHCVCHSNDAVKHVMSCCDQCDKCRILIRITQTGNHQLNCHPEADKGI